jgi:CD2 antigen cytoplasmic tail-binding protein 2
MSRYAAARPKRAGEAFARAHHADIDGSEGSSPNKKVKFDVRNPSALARGVDGEDEDAGGDADNVLAADVIGGSRATKRGAVNIDGYDSDSDNENFESRAEERGKKGGGDDIQLAEVMDSYGKGSKAKSPDDDEEVDMFAADDDEAVDSGEKSKLGKKRKDVRFLAKIEGQEDTSKSGGTVRMDEQESSDDEEDVALAIEEEGVDEEVGLGGLKRNAPKIDAFNMREEQEDGAFDEAGNYIRKAADADDVHDRWLEGLSKKDMKKAAAAHEKREAELRQQQKEDDRLATSDLLKTLILNLDKGETALEALARLGKRQVKPKKIPKWKLKKTKGGTDDADVDMQETDEAAQAKIKESISAITDAADKLLRRDNQDIYSMERELLIREYRNETGEAWVEPSNTEQEVREDAPAAKMWEYRWTDGRDGGAKQGPFDSSTMKAWQDAGYFGEGVEFRSVGDPGWSKVALFG